MKMTFLYSPHTAVIQTDFGSSVLSAEQTSAQAVSVTGKVCGQD